MSDSIERRLRCRLQRHNIITTSGEWIWRHVVMSAGTLSLTGFNTAPNVKRHHHFQFPFHWVIPSGTGSSERDSTLWVQTDRPDIRPRRQRQPSQRATWLRQQTNVATSSLQSINQSTCQLRTANWHQTRENSSTTTRHSNCVVYHYCII